MERLKTLGLLTLKITKFKKALITHVVSVYSLLYDRFHMTITRYIEYCHALLRRQGGETGASQSVFIVG